MAAPKGSPSVAPARRGTLMIVARMVRTRALFLRYGGSVPRRSTLWAGDRPRL